MNKKYAIALTLFAAAATWMATAEAGMKGTWPLTVNTAARKVTGSIGSIRNATNNSNAYLGVMFSQVAGLPSPPPPSFAEAAVLFFRPANGQNTFVSIEDPNLLEIARTITTDSYIEFTWDANFVCQSITVEQSSPVAPKAL